MNKIAVSTAVRAGLFATALAVGFAIGSAGVNAADLPMPAYKSAPVVGPIYNWTGIYVDANAGYRTGKQDPLGLFSNDFGTFNYTLSDGIIGGRVDAKFKAAMS
jgi:outer membrane immunogenic protein